MTAAPSETEKIEPGDTLGAAYGAARLEARLGIRRAGPGPDPGARLRPLGLEGADFLFFLMMSSRVMSRAADMVDWDLEGDGKLGKEGGD